MSEGASTTVIVAGALAQRPGISGHAWVFVNWLLGAASLGHRVVFVDHIDAALGDQAAGARWVRDVMGAADLADSWCVLLDGARTAGLGRADVAAMASDAVLINVMGYLDDEEIIGRCSRRLFLDIDPGFGQSWAASDLAQVFVGHDAYATVGWNVGRPGCGVPDLDFPWIHTLPPVDLDRWRSDATPNGPFTTVAAWRGPFGPVEIDGVVHGLRVHEARRFADLPRRSGCELEMALQIDVDDAVDRALLESGGWRLRDPGAVAGDVDSYRRYVHGSSGELSIAKQVYVRLRTGWFSDRSACYLASGRPVIVSDTGLDHLPLGEGLLTFGSPDEAEQALAEVMAGLPRHGKAAQAIAEAHFDARLVVGRLLDRLP